MHRRDLLLAGMLAGTGTLSPVARAQAALDQVKLRELYNKDLTFSDYARSMAGERVAVTGYMAPPLKADARFFVLTKRPMSVCPFCETEAQWPDDILAVYTKRTLEVVPFNVGIVTSGWLELGTFRDPETGFVSRVRLADASYQRG